jgi:hypothetical protein
MRPLNVPTSTNTGVAELVLTIVTINESFSIAPLNGATTKLVVVRVLVVPLSPLSSVPSALLSEKMPCW